MSAPLLPERVPPLTRRLHELLRSLPPGRAVTEAELAGWLSVTEDPRGVALALDILRTTRAAVHHPGARPRDAGTWSAA